MREGCARKEWISTYIKSEHNVADLLTKPLPSGEKRLYFVRKILVYIWADYSWGCGLHLRKQGEPHHFLFGNDFDLSYVEYNSLEPRRGVECIETTTILSILDLCGCVEDHSNFWFNFTWYLFEGSLRNAICCNTAPRVTVLPTRFVLLLPPILLNSHVVGFFEVAKLLDLLDLMRWRECHSDSEKVHSTM